MAFLDVGKRGDCGMGMRRQKAAPPSKATKEDAIRRQAASVTDPNKPTMYLRDVKSEPDRQAILHEFGHIPGLRHGIQHPKSGISGGPRTFMTIHSRILPSTRGQLLINRSTSGLWNQLASIKREIAARESIHLPTFAYSRLCGPTIAALI